MTEKSCTDGVLTTRKRGGKNGVLKKFAAVKRLLFSSDLEKKSGETRDVETRDTSTHSRNGRQSGGYCSDDSPLDSWKRRPSLTNRSTAQHGTAFDFPSPCVSHANSTKTRSGYRYLTTADPLNILGIQVDKNTVDPSPRRRHSFFSGHVTGNALETVYRMQRLDAFETYAVDHFVEEYPKRVIGAPSDFILSKNNRVSAKNTDRGDAQQLQQKDPCHYDSNPADAANDSNSYRSFYEEEEDDDEEGSSSEEAKQELKTVFRATAMTPNAAGTVKTFPELSSKRRGRGGVKVCVYDLQTHEWRASVLFSSSAPGQEQQDVERIRNSLPRISLPVETGEVNNRNLRVSPTVSLHLYPLEES